MNTSHTLPPARHRPLLLFGGLYLFWMALLFRPALVSIDGTGYYSWIQSLVVHHDLNTDPLFLTRACGGLGHSNCLFQRNPYGIGVALFLSPFFLLAHLFAPLLHAPQDGLSRPYILLCSLGSSLWGFAGLLLCWRIATLFFPERAATLACLTLWLGSPLLFYMIPNNFLSHSVDLFVNALFLYVYVKTRGSEHPRIWLLYGLLIGLAMTVRMPNIFLGIIPVAESIARLRAGERHLGPEAVRYTPLAAGLLLAMTPQMLVWKLTRGRWFLLNPYKGATHDTIDFLHPHLWEVLFSTNHGFLLWAPAFLIALVSLPLLARRDPRLTAGLALLVLLDWYLVSSWDYWYGDAAFGPRLFLNLIPVAVLGLSVLLDRASARVPLSALRAVAGCLVLWTLLLMGQYALKLIPSNTGVSVPVLLHNQLTLIPDHAGQLLHALAGHRPQPHP
ncbi:MAG: glycosyltransferase family 39 protein [Armatimonadetes bacterium]|nr:glycosyltransferase family 39 protein [Armatimonadota bacterium]